MKYILGIGGVTNGGKTTLTNRLIKALPNCCVVHQDDFYKVVPTLTFLAIILFIKRLLLSNDLYDEAATLESLDMDAMLSTVQAWIEKPRKFARAHGVNVPLNSKEPVPEDTHLLVIEGFLLYNYTPLTDLFNQRYYLTVPYDECKRRRSTRNYTIPDPPGLFDGHVWPMYLKYRTEMETNEVDVVYLDGMKTRDELYHQVLEDIQNTLLNCS